VRHRDRAAGLDGTLYGFKVPPAPQSDGREHSALFRAGRLDKGVRIERLLTPRCRSMARQALRRTHQGNWEPCSEPRRGAGKASGVLLGYLCAARVAAERSQESPMSCEQPPAVGG
jgi:hypothetical protein